MKKSSPKTDIIYLVPHTHYDAIWVFTKEDYFYINIEFILKKAVELIEKKNNYKFLIEQTYLLEEIEKRHPALFKKIKRFIKEGKIEIADGEYLMADTMLPGGETLVREILFGKRYIKEKFGKEVPVMWQADSFGLNAQLPQIYKKAGYKYVAFRRGAAEDKPSEFWWQGLDGTRILTHWMPLGYRAGLDLTRLKESYRKLKKAAATRHILMPSGSGVTMPQPETVEAAKDWNKAHRSSKMKIANSVEFFEALKRDARNLTVRKGEFYSGRFSRVFPNVCSSRMWIKQELRKCENLMLSCERWAALSLVLGNSYPQLELSRCWKKVLFGAFHDAVPGTGADQCYGELKKDFSFLKTRLSKLITKSFSAVSNDLEGTVVVFNSLSWEVKNWVESELKFVRGAIKKIEGLKSGVEELEIEILEFARYEDGSLRKAKIGFIATVPALGYKSYQILESSPKISSKNAIKIDGNTLRNQFFKMKIEPDTGLIDIFQQNRRIANGNELILEEEVGDLYYHQQSMEAPLKTEGGEGVKYGRFKVKNFGIKKSPLRSVINIEEDYYSLRWPYRLTSKTKPLLWRHNLISIVKKIIVYRDLPRIDFITQVNNHHPRIRMRVKFTTTIKSSTYSCESQFGVVQRPVNQYRNKAEGWREKPYGIYPSLNWIDYSNKKKGLTVINQGIPANEVRDGNIYLTLLRSVSMLSSQGVAGPAIPVPDAAEFKNYNFSYSLLPHRGNWKKAESFKAGSELNCGLTAIQLPAKKHSGFSKNGSRQFSFVEIKPENLVLAALKKAEDSDEIILRLFETKGEKTRGKINLFKEPKKVQLVDLLESEDSEGRNCLKWEEGKKIGIAVKPFEIISLKIKF